MARTKCTARRFIAPGRGTTTPAVLRARRYAPATTGWLYAVLAALLRALEGTVCAHGFYWDDSRPFIPISSLRASGSKRRRTYSLVETYTNPSGGRRSLPTFRFSSRHWMVVHGYLTPRPGVPLHSSYTCLPGCEEMIVPPSPVLSPIRAGYIPVASPNPAYGYGSPTSPGFPDSSSDDPTSDYDPTGP